MGLLLPKSQQLNVCYLVTHYPQLSETFVSNSYKKALEHCGAHLVARLRKADSRNDHLLSDRQQDPFVVAQDAPLTIGDCSKMISIIQKYGAQSDNWLSHRRIGYRTLIKCAYSLVKILKCCAASSPDVIHATFAGNALWSRVVAQELSIPFTIAVHGSDIRRCKENDEVARCIHKAAAVTCVDDHGYKILVDRLHLPEEKVGIVPNGVDMDKFKPISAPRPRQLLSVGRLHDVKGHDVLLQAMSILKDRNVRCHLEIIGKGPEREKLRRMIDELSLTDQVRLVGAVPNNQLLEYISRACLLVQPSRAEGLPCTLLEAMACARPIVCTAVGGMKQLVGDHLGYQCKPDDPEDLASTIKHALSDPEELKIKGMRGFDLVARQYSWEIHIQKLMSIWRSVTGVSE